MTIHPQRFESVPFLADTQLQRLRNTVGIHPRLKGIIVYESLLHCQRGDVPAFAVNFQPPDKDI